MGATSGIGYEVALLLAQRGWKVGIAGRREEILSQMMKLQPGIVAYEVIDVTSPQATEGLQRLITKLGHMELSSTARASDFRIPLWMLRKSYLPLRPTAWVWPDSWVRRSATLLLIPSERLSWPLSAQLLVPRDWELPQPTRLRSGLPATTWSASAN